MLCTSGRFLVGSSAWCRYTSQWKWKQNGFWNLLNSASGYKGLFRIWLVMFGLLTAKWPVAG